MVQVFFLAYAFDVLADFYAFYLPKDTFEWLSKILDFHLHGIDTDIEAVNITSTILKLKALDRLKYRPEKTPELNVKHDNFLMSDFKEDKFSIILGNPPYGVSFNKSESKVIQSRFETFKSPDSSCFFIEKAVKMLEDNGILGFIVPKTLSYVLSWRHIREFLLRECKITHIADAKKAFKGVLLEQIVLIAEKNKCHDKKTSIFVLNHEDLSVSHDIDNTALTPNMFSIWLGRKGIKDIFDKIWEKSVPIAEIGEIWNGLSQTSLFDAPDSENSEICLRGRDIKRYHIDSQPKYVRLKDLKEKKSILLDRYFRPKIVMQDIVAHIKHPTPHIKLMAAIDDSKSWVNMNTVTNITCLEYDLEYLCGILNSRLMSWYVHNFIYNRATRTMHFRLGYAENIPIYSIKSASRSSEVIYEQLTNHVKQIIDLYNKFPLSTLEIARLDININRLVCQLYGITDKDIIFLKENAGFY